MKNIYLFMCDEAKDEITVTLPDGRQFALGDEIKPDPVVLTPENTDGCLLTRHGHIEATKRNSPEHNRDCYKYDNWRPTEKETRALRDRRRLTRSYVDLIAKLNHDNDGWEPDWNNSKQSKYYISIHWTHEGAAPGCNGAASLQWLSTALYFGQVSDMDLIRDVFSDDEIYLIVTGERR